MGNGIKPRLFNIWVASVLALTQSVHAAGPLGFCPLLVTSNTEILASVAGLQGQLIEKISPKDLLSKLDLKTIPESTAESKDETRARISELLLALQASSNPQPNNTPNDTNDTQVFAYQLIGTEMTRVLFNLVEIQLGSKLDVLTAVSGIERHVEKFMYFITIVSLYDFMSTHFGGYDFWLYREVVGRGGARLCFCSDGV